MRRQYANSTEGAPNGKSGFNGAIVIPGINYLINWGIIIFGTIIRNIR
jgi:hypothetical protein